MKAFWKSKTFWVNAVTLGLAVSEPVLGIKTIPEPDPALLAFVNLALRWVTTQPVGVKSA